MYSYCFDFLKVRKNVSSLLLEHPESIIFFLFSFIIPPLSVPKVISSILWNSAKISIIYTQSSKKLKNLFLLWYFFFNSEHCKDMLHNSKFQQIPGNQAVCIAQMRPDLKRLVVTSVVTSFSDSRQVARCIYKVWCHPCSRDEKKKKKWNDMWKIAFQEELSGKIMANYTWFSFSLCFYKDPRTMNWTVEP